MEVTTIGSTGVSRGNGESEKRGLNALLGDSGVGPLFFDYLLRLITPISKLDYPDNTKGGAGSGNCGYFKEPDNQTEKEIISA
jgi:hypothetical protein